MTAAAYHRHGCSQSGKRLIVRSQLRHQYRRTQTTIHPSFQPRTCREYNPCPCTCTVPLLSRANCPQYTHHRGRSSSTEGAPALRAQTCSTPAARLCRMTTVFGAVVSRYGSLGKRAHLQSPPFFLPAVHPTQISEES